MSSLMPVCGGGQLLRRDEYNSRLYLRIACRLQPTLLASISFVWGHSSWRLWLIVAHSWWVWVMKSKGHRRCFQQTYRSKQCLCDTENRPTQYKNALAGCWCVASEFAVGVTQESAVQTCDGWLRLTLVDWCSDRSSWRLLHGIY